VSAIGEPHARALLLQSKELLRRGVPTGDTPDRGLLREWLLSDSVVRLCAERVASLRSNDLSGLEEFFPSRGALMEDIAALRVVDSEGDGERYISDELVKDEIARMRYRPEDVDDRGLGPRWGKAWGVALDLMGREDREVWSEYLSRVPKGADDAAVRSYLKKITTIYKRGGVELSPSWKMFVNGENLGGYRLPGATSFEDEVVPWLIEGKDLEVAGSVRAFLEMFRKGVREFLRRAPSVEKANGEEVSWQAFTEDPGLWGRPGASTEKSGIKVNGRAVRKNKWASALAMGPEDVRHMIFGEDLFQYPTLIEKLEEVKRRLVMNSDLKTYLRMAYPSIWIFLALANHPNTPLYSDSRTRVNWWKTRAGMFLLRWFVPLDQSKFDNIPFNLMLAVVCWELFDWVRTSCTWRAYDVVMACLAVACGTIVNGGFIEGRRFDKGVLSGWLWTALLDTIINFALWWVCNELARLVGLQCLEVQAAGDDDAVVAEGPLHCVGLARIYGMIGLDVNPTKFFISNNRDEFLRVVGTAEEASGYMLRGVKGIFWRNPIASDPPAGLGRLREQWAQWNLLLSRGADVRGVLKHGLRDMANANGLRVAEVWRWLCTPASVGGAGAWYGKRVEPLAVTDGSVKREGVVTGRLRGVEHAAKWWSRFGIEVNVRDKLDGNWRVEVTPGRRFIPEVRRLRGGLHSRGGSRGPPHPHFKRDVPMLGREGLTGKELWRLRRSLLQDESVTLAEYLWRNCSMGVAYSWLEGKLPFSVPAVAGWSPEAVSVVHKEFAGAGFWLCVERRYKGEGWKSVGVACEDSTHLALREWTWRYGG